MIELDVTYLPEKLNIENMPLGNKKRKGKAVDFTLSP
jgi:hypothetical protein